MGDRAALKLNVSERLMVIRVFSEMPISTVGKIACRKDLIKELELTGEEKETIEFKEVPDGRGNQRVTMNISKADELEKNIQLSGWAKKALTAALVYSELIDGLDDFSFRVYQTLCLKQ